MNISNLQFLQHRKELQHLAKKDAISQTREAWKSEINVLLTELNNNLENQLYQARVEVENVYKHQVEIESFFIYIYLQCSKDQHLLSISLLLVELNRITVVSIEIFLKMQEIHSNRAKSDVELSVLRKECERYASMNSALESKLSALRPRVCFHSIFN